jgi:SAM-dependent methyltransferase
VGVVRDFVADGTGLPDARAGRAMLFNILHIESPLRLLREAYRVLAPGGEAAIIHWRRDIETLRGPSLRIRPTAERCRAWGEQVGFEFVRNEGLRCCSWHWGLVMRRPGKSSLLGN